jgi:hypothetical protein
MCSAYLKKRGSMANRNDVPTQKFFEGYDLNKIWDIADCLDNLIFSIREGYFLTWEAVVRDEQGLPLSEKQEDALDSLLNFGDDDDDDDTPILYIDEMPRPSEPWYESVRKLAPKLILNPFKTFEIYDETYHEGWSDLVSCLQEYADDLSLPEGISSPIEVVPPEIRHRLWLQFSFDDLSGLGQEEELTLENEEQRPWRIEGFIRSLKEVKESVEYFNLSLDDLFNFVALPPKDEKILRSALLKELGMKSSSGKLGDFL